MNAPRLIELTRPDDRALAAEAAAGLLQAQAAVPPKFLYDTLGSRLFDAITELPEYYPTRTEAALFQQHMPEIAAAVRACTGPAPVLVDLGAGTCTKAARLFTPLRPRRYVAVDIALAFVAEALRQLQREHPALELVGVGLDFSQRLVLPEALVDGPVLVFYPGSSIGNFDLPAARELLRQAHALSAGGALLIGVDLVKPRATLEAAYDDALGVTAAFNLNLLRHLNRVLQADFDVRQWRHVALYNEPAARVEMHLEARQPLVVRWPGAARTFAAGERIHTENAYKWSLGAFESLLQEAGWRKPRAWCDSEGRFALVLATA